MIFNMIAKKVESFKIQKSFDSSCIMFELDNVEFILKENGLDLYCFDRSGREMLVENFDNPFALNRYIKDLSNSTLESNTRVNNEILTFLAKCDGFVLLEYFVEKGSYYCRVFDEYFYFRELEKNLFLLNSKEKMTLSQLKNYISSPQALVKEK